MSRTDEGPQERFEEFLRTYKDEHGTKVYWPKCQQMSLNDETSLLVDFQDLVSFDNVFAVLASENPQKFLADASSALLSILGTDDPDYVEKLDVSTIKIRIINYSEHVPLRHIRSKHIGKLIQINGILMRASEVKPLLVEAVFRCRVCGQDIPQTQEEGRYTEPPLCPTCGKKTAMRLIPEQSRFIDWQKVRVQESPEELPPGQMPRFVDVIFGGDIVDVSRPGDLVKLTGILQTSPDFSRHGGRLATFNIFIEANGAEIAEKEYEQVEISEEDEKRIRELAEDPFVHERVYASIAPSIQGHEQVKESIALLLFGGVEKVLSDGTRLRGRSNILMIGDPGTGKSQILKFVAGLASRGLYTSGKGTTAAGLTAAVIHDTDTGAMTLEAGALVLADQGVACIDEFDKMDPDDRTSIHEAMEQHSFHPSSEIYLSDGSRRPIGNLVDKLFEDHSSRVVKGVNCEILDTQGLDLGVYTTDFSGIGMTNVDRVSRHPAPSHFVKITYDNGRDVIVTPDHPVFVFRDDKISTVFASDLQAGAFVPAPRMQPCGHNPGAALSQCVTTHPLATPITLPNRLSPQLARILGYFITEGYSYDGSSAEFGFSTTSNPIKEEILNLMEDTFGLKGIDYVTKNRTIRFVSARLRDFFNRNFPEVMALARNKRIPSQAFVSGEKVVRNLLRTAFLGDGSVESTGMCYRTASQGLAYDYQDLLLCIGIQSRIVHDIHNDSYKVYVRGSSLPLFYKELIEDWDPRIEKIKRIVVRSDRSNYNHDAYPPYFGAVLKSLYQQMGMRYHGEFYRCLHEGFGITRDVLKSHLKILKEELAKSQVDFDNSPQTPKSLRQIVHWSQATAAEKISKKRSVMSYAEHGGYSNTVIECIIASLGKAVQEELELLSQRILQIDAMLESNIAFLRVRKIEKVPNNGRMKSAYAYDVTVEPNHCFISDGVILHNTVSIAKAGIVATLNARTSILAAANPALGRYEPSLSMQDNIKLPFTILSRFDLIWILVDTVEPTKDRELAQFILNMHQRKKNPTKDSTSPIPPEFLKKYIGFANRYVIPQLTPEAAEVMEDFYVDLRKSAEGGAAPVPITARQLESLVRLAEARARMALRPKVTKEDAQAAVRLMQESLRMVAFDTVTGKIDIDRLVSKMSAAQRSSSDIILKAIKDMEAEGTPVVSEDALLQRVTSMGLSKERAEEVIRKLVSEGILFNPREGKIKRAQI